MRTRPPVTDWASDFDHLDPAWVDNPYPIWDELQQKCPIAHTDRYMGVYFVSRHEDVRAVALDTEHFSSRLGIFIREGRPPVTPAPPITSDPPVHSAQKKLLLPAFTPDAIRRYEPQTRAICRELLEPIASRSSCDGAIDYAQEIPVRVIATMLGVPSKNGDLFRRWFTSFSNSASPIGMRWSGRLPRCVRSLPRNRRTPEDASRGFDQLSCGAAHRWAKAR